MEAIIYCDGACEPVNPGGLACFGWVAYWQGRKAREGSGVVCRGQGATNNVAEYTAVIEALKYLTEKGYAGPVLVRSDSQLVIKQLQGSWSAGSPHLLPLYLRVRELCRAFERVSFEWIPREQNTEADRLSKQAYADALVRATTFSG